MTSSLIPELMSELSSACRPRSILEGRIELTLSGSGKTISQPSHSFVMNMAYAFRASCMYALDNRAKTTNNTNISVLTRNSVSYVSGGYSYTGGGTAGLEVAAAASIDASGIVVGKGPGAFNLTNYKLADQILHGTGAANLVYGVSTAPTSVFTDATGCIRVIRDFTNVSGNPPIDIAEVGLIGTTGGAASGSVVRVLISRDVLASAVTIQSGETLLVSYVLTGEL